MQYGQPCTISCNQIQSNVWNCHIVSQYIKIIEKQFRARQGFLSLFTPGTWKKKGKFWLKIPTWKGLWNHSYGKVGCKYLHFLIINHKHIYTTCIILEVQANFQSLYHYLEILLSHCSNNYLLYLGQLCFQFDLSWILISVGERQTSMFNEL